MPSTGPSPRRDGKGTAGPGAADETAAAPQAVVASRTGKKGDGHGQPGSRTRWPLVLAGMSLAGAVLSGYLWQAKVGAASLVCGPVGDCVTVNASPFSEVLGVPIALLGMLMYAVLAGTLLVVWWRPATVLSQFGFALALAGAIFSLYLTFIEAFVLRAYCVWCLTSWLLITAITWTWGRALRRAAA